MPSIPYFAHSVEAPFAGNQRIYWARPSDREDVRKVPYGTQALKIAEHALLGVGGYYGIPFLRNKRPADFWYNVVRNVEEFSPFKIFGTFRLGEVLSASIDRSGGGPLSIALDKLSVGQLRDTSSYLRHMPGLNITQPINQFKALKFAPEKGTPFGQLFGVMHDESEVLLKQRVRGMRPGRFLESLISVVQPGLGRDVEFGRSVFGGHSTGWVPVGTQGTLRDVVTGIRSYAAFSAQRLGELVHRVGEEIPLPGILGGNIRGLFKKIGLDLKPQRASFSRTLLGYGKFATILGATSLGISTLDAMRNMDSTLANTLGLAGTSAIFYKAGSRIARSLGKAPIKGGLIGLGLSAAQLLPSFNAGLKPGLASIIPTLSLIKSQLGQATGMNAYRSWVETNFPGATGVGTSLVMGGLGALGAYSYAARKVALAPGASYGGMFGTLRGILPVVRQEQARLSGQPLGRFSELALKKISQENQGIINRAIKDLGKEAGGISKLFGSPAAHEGMEVASRIRSLILKQAVNPLTSGGFFKREGQRLLASAAAGRLAGAGRIALLGTAAWFVATGGLGSEKSPEELRAIYSGEQLVPVKRGRAWELGSSPYEGKDTLYYRQHWSARIRARAEEAGASGRLPMDEWFLKNFTYQLERENYEQRPYTISGAAGDEIPFVYPLIQPFTDLIKRPKLLHVPEWARIGPEGDVQLRYVEDALTPAPVESLGGVPPGAPVSPYSGSQMARRFFYENTELAGLVGFATQSMYTNVTGADFPFGEDVTLQSASQMNSLRRRFWAEQMGGAFMGIPFMSESVRRFLPAYPASQEEYHPLRNQLPDWMPEDMKWIGDPYVNLRYGLGEERLPGPLYERLYNVGPEGYGLPHKLRILADTASWSKEYREAARGARDYFLTMYDDDYAHKYFYKTTNKITGEVYYGAHKTNDLNDEYIGSGTRLQAGIAQYGRSAFKNEILKRFDTSKELFDYERNFVNPDLLAQPGILNMAPGGQGFRDLSDQTAGEIGADMAQTLANLREKRNKVDFDYYGSSGFGGYNSAGQLFELNESAKERGFLGKTVGRAWEGFAHGLGKVLAPIEHIMPGGIAPYSKLMDFRDPIEEYEASKVFGTEYKFWSDPWKNWFRPAAVSLKRFWLGDMSIPGHVQEMRDTQQYYDVLKWYKYQQLAMQAGEAGQSDRVGEYKRVAKTTAFGANPFSSESANAYTLPYSERPYFQAFAGAIDPGTQAHIQQIVPEYEAGLLQGAWQRRKMQALMAQQELGTITSADETQLAQLQALAGREGKPYSESLFAQYRQTAPQNTSYADWYRMKEAETFLAQYKLPNPEWAAWRPDVDLEDVKLKEIQNEGKSHYDFDIFASRVGALERKPYLDSTYTREDFVMGDRQLTPDPYTTHRDIRAILNNRGIRDRGINYSLNSPFYSSNAINMNIRVQPQTAFGDSFG